ncbi:MAG: S41 family peptidase [Alphaproteobacteria bacterium]|nr:S41 family peptidase [Alphaproteobacteria bacterium]
MQKALLAGVAGVIGFGVALVTLPMTNVEASSETYRQLDLFGDVLEQVRSKYVREVDDPELVEAAINGMLNSLDPHSSYLSAKDFRDMQVQTRGEFGGLGIEVTMEEGIIKVVAPMDDTPAARAGIKPGDYISHIDGTQIMGMTLNDAVERMRGPANTSVTLTILREGTAKPFDVTLTRAIVKVQSVRYRKEGDVGYIRITTFNEQTEDGLIDAINALKSEIGPSIKGYILDLRNNPGGLLDQAIGVSDAFLEQGEVVSTRGRYASDVQRYNARAGDLIDGKPLIVLINGGSASASEIVAGALQDHGRAKLVGLLSFGKGSVQTVIPLDRGQGALRLTTAKYYTPAGRSIQATGIDPDIEVAMKAKGEEGWEEETKRRSEADLPQHLEAEADGQRGEHVVIRPKPGEKHEDFQLDYALSLLRGTTIAFDSQVVSEVTKPQTSAN